MVMADDQNKVILDVGNLACFDGNDIVNDGTNFEEILRSTATKNANLIIKQIFDLPRDPQMAGVPGVVVTLPKPSTHIPREKPLPKPKPLTKWEQFAKEKGIVKRKKSRMVYDEDKEEYRPRYGYKKANDETTAWAIPAKAGEDPTEDPWTRMEREKKERVDKNKKQQANNVKAALKQTQGKNRIEGAIDLAAVAEAAEGPKGRKAQKKGSKHHVDVALSVAQKSTASMGMFDKVHSYEPAPKMVRAAKKEAELAADVQKEKSQSMAVLNNILGITDNAPTAQEKASRLVHKEVMMQDVNKHDKKGKGKKRKSGADGIGRGAVMDSGKETGKMTSSKKGQKKAGTYGGKFGQGKGSTKGSSKMHKKQKK